MSDGNDTQKKIAEITEAIRDLLLYKNRQYGNSVLQPNHIFYKGDAVNSILIRLDDKLGRIKANTEDSPRINDIADIIGYCTLLLISIGADKADIENLKD